MKPFINKQVNNEKHIFEKQSLSCFSHVDRGFDFKRLTRFNFRWKRNYFEFLLSEQICLEKRTQEQLKF